MQIDTNYNTIIDEKKLGKTRPAGARAMDLNKTCVHFKIISYTYTYSMLKVSSHYTV